MPLRLLVIAASIGILTAVATAKPVTLGTVITTGSVSHTRVAKVVKTARTMLAACRTAADEPRKQAVLVVIGTDGVPVTIEPNWTTELGECVVRVLDGLRFPAAAAATTVTFQLTFPTIDADLTSTDRDREAIARAMAVVGESDPPSNEPMYHRANDDDLWQQLHAREDTLGQVEPRPDGEARIGTGTREDDDPRVGTGSGPDRIAAGIEPGPEGVVAVQALSIVSGRRTLASVRIGADALAVGARRCYRTAQHDDGSLAGTMDLTIRIAASGSAEATIAAGHPLGDAVAACVVERARRFTARRARGATVITLTLAFSPGGP